MKQKDKDARIIAAALQRLNEYRLPRILSLKKTVDSGKVLDNFDLQFLQRVLNDAAEMHPIVKRNPEYLELWDKAIGLCEELLEKSAENESGT